MKYVSTRGQAEPVDFLEACLTGLAPDGGLYVPETWPSIERPEAGARYSSVAADILSAFAGASLDAETVLSLCQRAYDGFAHHSVAPLVQFGPGAFLMELHHGPTLAFKDVAMQFIGQLYEHALSAQDRYMTIICATSGDTGGAAAAAFAGLERVKLVILHPDERISPVQRLFMTSTGASNIINLAVKSDFDACQAMVKALFAERDFVEEVSLSGVNSINWARIAAQSVYFSSAQAQMGRDHTLRFIVPSGNMGDALAGYVAARCGLLNGLDIVCAVNANDSLSLALNEGRLKRSETIATPSPAMDITVPSNLERVIFEASGRDGARVREIYQAFAQSGDVHLPIDIGGPMGCMGFAAGSVSNAETEAEIARFRGETDWLICPHTAVGTALRRKLQPADATDIVLATAHPAKFPETIEAVTGRHPGLPERCANAIDGGEVYEIVPADLDTVRARIRSLVSQ